jgi:hypothetical protein
MKKTLILLMLVISQYGYSQLNTESKEYNEREIIKYAEGTKEYQAIKEKLDDNVKIIVEDIILTVNSSTVKSNMILENPKTFPSGICPTITVGTFGSTDPYSFPRFIMTNYLYGCVDDVEDRRSGSIISLITNDRDVIGTEMITTFKDYYWNNISINGTLKMRVEKLDDRVGKSATLHYQSTYDLILTVNGTMKYRYSGEKYKVVRR